MILNIFALIRWCHKSAQFLSLSRKGKRLDFFDLSKQLIVPICELKALINGLVLAGVDIVLDDDGCCFLSDVKTYDMTQIESFLGSTCFEIFWSLPSTNDFCLSDACSEDLEFCIAENQTAGRGRRANKWSCSFGSGILLTRRVKVSTNIDFSAYSPLLALMVVNGFKCLWPTLPIELKWPNDILIDGKKLMGILIEKSHQDKLSTLVIGLGCNVNKVDARLPFVGLLNHVFDLDKTALLIKLIEILRESLNVFIEKGFAPFVKEYDSLHCFHAQHIQYFENDTMQEGYVEGIFPSGRLQVSSKDGLKLLSQASLSKVRLKTDC